MMRKFLCLAFLLLFPLAAKAQELGGFTNMTFDPGHGTQVEYLAADGHSFLWYPGNRVILPGQWKREGNSVCFAYGPNTYNPVTGTSGGDFECSSIRDFAAHITERRAGDVLALEGRSKVPFALSAEQTTLQRLIDRVR